MTDPAASHRPSGRVTRWVDSAVGVFSPVAALRRSLARAAIALNERSALYAAADTTRLTGGWSPVNDSPNTVIGASSANVRARVRQLVRDMPYFSRAVRIMTDYTVGDGIRFQSQVKGADGKRDKASIQKIEDELSFWMDTADFARKLHFYEIMALAKRQDLECGEFLIVKRTPKSMRGRRVPFALQIIEPDWLTSLNTSPFNSTNKIDQGIEYDAETGEVLAYHLADPWGWGRAERIPADDVIHAHETLRPGQLRGISPFVPGVLMARDLDDIMTAELDCTKLATKYLAIIETPDPLGRQGAIGATTDPSTGKKIEELENAIIEYTRPGEKINFAKSERPGTNFAPFVRLVLTIFSITTGAPYELVSGDYQGLNFSTARITRNDFANLLRPVASRHVRHFCMRALVPWMSAAVASGRLQLPGYFANPVPWLASRWQPPGMEPVDPLREVKSNIDEMGVLLRSPQEIAQSRGRDLEEIYDEIAEAKELADERGLELVLQQPSTAQANNPAAIEEQKMARAIERLVRRAVESNALLSEGYEGHA